MEAERGRRNLEESIHNNNHYQVLKKIHELQTGKQNSLTFPSP